uniref:Uncharacterized protein n=1 Tax=Oryctolagus cuniculus TaxID=9986 RepID=G1TYY7_RABIT
DKSPTAMLWKTPLFAGLVVLGTHFWTIQKEFVDVSQNLDYFVASVEFAVAQFNDDSTEEQVYRLLEVDEPWCDVSFPTKDSMDLELGRTICKKHDEDIDNCPLQEDSDLALEHMGWVQFLQHAVHCGGCEGDGVSQRAGDGPRKLLSHGAMDSVGRIQSLLHAVLVDP